MNIRVLVCSVVLGLRWADPRQISPKCPIRRSELVLNPKSLLGLKTVSGAGESNDAVTANVT